MGGTRTALRPIIVASMLSAAAGIAFAAPANAGCETQAFAQYCDSPARPDGTWDRCQTAFGQGYPGLNGYVPTTSRCYPIDPAQPWPTFPLGQPQHHIYP
jgi:hypothetical protein